MLPSGKEDYKLLTYSKMKFLNGPKMYLKILMVYSLKTHWMISTQRHVFPKEVCKSTEVTKTSEIIEVNF